jgi:alkylation response protein AidB-like acyl-CoA dehydrogenase
MRTDEADSAEEAVAALLTRLQPVIRASSAHARTLDEVGGFPTDDVAALARAGALRAVVPTLLGGLGIGTEPGRAAATAAVLHLLGSGSISLGRIYEAHLNAVRLVMRHGDAFQRRAAARDARAGQLYALWVTDADDGLRFIRTSSGIELRGGKQFCSAAGHATRAVVTATSPEGERFLLALPLQCGEVVHRLPSGLQGVRSACTGCVDFTGAAHAAEAIFGGPDGYLSEPDFSCGAWRSSAVAAGGLSALVEAVRAELVGRGRADMPEQRERLGRMLIHAQTARLWLLHAAPIAEDADQNPCLAAATVNLARIAIEAASLDTIQLAQRSLGLSAFMRRNPVELICRDLATYLRQPAPDEALNEAAGHFAANPVPNGLP